MIFSHTIPSLEHSLSTKDSYRILPSAERLSRKSGICVTDKIEMCEVSTELKGQSLLYVLIMRRLVCECMCVWVLLLYLLPDATSLIVFFFSFPAVCVSLHFFPCPCYCFRFCEEDRLSTGMNLEKEKGVKKARSGRWEGRSVHLKCLLCWWWVTVWQGNTFKALLYQFQAPPPLLYVTDWVFMWSLLLATPGLHSDLLEYMADGEDRPLSLFILLCFCLSVSCSGRIACTCLKSLRGLLIFTECVFLSNTLPVSQSAGRVKSMCESLSQFTDLMSKVYV